MPRRTDVPFSASLNMKANGFSINVIPSGNNHVDESVFSGPTALSDALAHFNGLYSEAEEFKTKEE